MDDTTICEVEDKGEESCIQQVVDDLAIQARDEGFQLKESNAKSSGLAPQGTNQNFQITLYISSDLKWDVRVSELVRNVSI